MTWTQGNLRASVTFNENRAEKIDFTLPTANWSDAQVSAALDANGTGWTLIPYDKNTSLVASAMVQNSGFGIRQSRWLSTQGSDAALTGLTMTIRSADLVNAEVAKKQAEEANKNAVPNF